MRQGKGAVWLPAKMKLRSNLDKRRGRLNLRHAVAATLCLLSGLAVAGPSGLYAWHENTQLREEREQRLAALTAQRDRLRQRVALLDPARADPDLVGELIREKLNVLHPDEVIVTLKTEEE